VVSEAGLFLISFAAATILPFSSEAALVGAIQTGMPKYTAFTMASLGNVSAIIVNYLIGLILFKKSKTKLLRSKNGKHAWHIGRRYGYWGLLLSWLPVIGDPITIVAGVLRMNFWYFLFISATLRVARYSLLLIAF